ncbi:MAG TPA: class I SAM-dependent methyltransferase [Thermomonospora sp.]|nr:class I SAM-dependent methyltransferase [Thermomonospora sp.]
MTDDRPRPGFDHNAFYHRYLLRQVPSPCDRALDVGCGTGQFARRLAGRAREVEAIDRSSEVIARAREPAGGESGIRFLHADVADHDLGDSRYDFVSCIAAIHHMPFAETVTRLRRALRPGGVLAIVGCHREATPADYLRDLVAIPANVVANTVVRARARHGGGPTGQVGTAPVMDPEMTLPEIRREASRLLPGAVIRRRLYWRYTLVYRHPST